MQPRFCRQVFNNFSCADRFTLRFPHPFLRGTEFAENPLSKCVPLCRPTWVQGVISRKGALKPLVITFDLVLFLHALEYH